MLIQAKDKLFYQDPTWVTPEYLIRSDDYEGIRLSTVKTRQMMIMKRHGFHVRFLGRVVKEKISFPVNARTGVWNMTMVNTAPMEFVEMPRVPDEYVMRTDRPSLFGMWQAWVLRFEVEDILGITTGKWDSLLLRFLMNDPRIKKSIIRWLKKEVPDMWAMGMEDLKMRYPNGIELGYRH